MRWPIALALLSLLPTAAVAQQCASIDVNLKPKVVDLLQPGRQFVEYCEPCHDAAPGQPKAVEQVELAPVDKGAMTLRLNGRDTDLAFVFVETMPGSGRFVNAAKAVSCTAHDVSAEVHFAPPAPPAVEAAKPKSPAPAATASKTSAVQHHAVGQP